MLSATFTSNRNRAACLGGIAALFGLLAFAPQAQQAANPSWGLVIEAAPDAAVVTDAAVRSAITQSGLPWKVRHLSTGIELVLVPAGRFRMGASSGDSDAGKAESPAHEVAISKPFYIGRTEVTQGQWQSVMGSNPSRFQSAFFRDEAEQQRSNAIARITADGATKQEAESTLGPRPPWIDDRRGCRPKRSGNMPAEPEPRPSIPREMTKSRWQQQGGTLETHRARHTQSGYGTTTHLV